MSPDDRTFRFDQLDQTGVLLGLGILQLGLLSVGLVAAAVVVSSGIAGPIGLVPLALASVVAFGRIQGRPATEWLPVAVGWTVARTVRRRWFANLPSHPATRRLQPIALPPPLRGLAIIEAASPWHRLAQVGLVHDHIDETLTVLVPVQGRDFALLERSEQDGLLGRWGEVLGGFARERGLVVRLSWTEFAAPVGLDEHQRWLATASTVGHADRGIADTAVAESYRALLDGAGALTAEHQVMVSLTVSRDRVRTTRRTRARGSDTFVDGCISSTETLLRGLRNAGLAPGTPMTAAEIATVVRWRSDPAQMHRRSGTGAPAIDAGQAGPLALQSDWTQLRTDGSIHRTFWIAEWPRLPVHADWMEPLLAFTGAARRAITVIYQPVAPSSSRRRIDSESIRLESDAVAKEDKGRRVTAQHVRNQTAVAEREQELVAGFVEFDFAGLITVSAASEDELWEGCDHIEQVAREHGLELRALDGRHDVAWAAALPLGLGLGRGVIR